MKTYTRIIAAFVAVVIIFSSYAAPQAEAALVDDVIVSYSQSNLAQWTLSLALATAGEVVFGPIGIPVAGAIAAGINDLASWYAAGYTDEEILAAESDYVAGIQTEYGTTVLGSHGLYHANGASSKSSGYYASLISAGFTSLEFEIEGSGQSVDWIFSFPYFDSGNYTFHIPPVSCSCGSQHYYSGSRYLFEIYCGSSRKIYEFFDPSKGLDFVYGYPSVEGSVCSVRICTGSSFESAGYHKLSVPYAPYITGENYMIPPDPVSRPASITGNYGIIGDDGRLSMIRQQTIINEGDKTYYNPVTNTAHNMTGWTYDYSTRTYNVTAEDGSESIITYGDDNVIIQEGDQTYNVYYLAESTGTDSGGSGDDSGEDPGDDPGTGDHKHSYTDQITKDPGCTLPGVRTYTCSCGDSYTKTVPATGHDWSISSQVNASYDPATGELLQPGYVIYSCSTCGQQYKDDSNTGPPSSGSSGSSGEDSLFGKLGELLGTAGSGVLDLISSAIGKLLDGAIALLEMAFEKLGRVVEILLSLFDAVPQLFGGYLDMFGAVFAFIPEDIITLLTFGVACVIILGVWKMIRR